MLGNRSFFHGLTILGLALPSIATLEARADFLVSTTGAQQVLRFDDSGNYLGVFVEGVLNPEGLAIGPDGDLFVDTSTGVFRFDGATGASKGRFASADGLKLTFGPGGELFVTDGYGGQVLRYNGTTGAFMGVFAFMPQPALAFDLAFGTGGDLFLPNRFTGEVLRFDGTTSASKGTFVSGLSSPDILTFGPDGDLFVTGYFSGTILRFDGVTGASEGIFATPSYGVGTFGMSFGLDGDLFVAGPQGVYRFDGTTGAFEGLFADTGTSGAHSLVYIAPSAVPEPAGLLLMGTGTLGLMGQVILRARRSA